MFAKAWKGILRIISRRRKDLVSIVFVQRRQQLTIVTMILMVTESKKNLGNPNYDFLGFKQLEVGLLVMF